MACSQSSRSFRRIVVRVPCLRAFSAPLAAAWRMDVSPMPVSALASSGDSDRRSASGTTPFCPNSCMGRSPSRAASPAFGVRHPRLDVSASRCDATRHNVDVGRKLAAPLHTLPSRIARERDLLNFRVAIEIRFACHRQTRRLTNEPVLVRRERGALFTNQSRGAYSPQRCALKIEMILQGLAQALSFSRSFIWGRAATCSRGSSARNRSGVNSCLPKSAGVVKWLIRQKKKARRGRASCAELGPSADGGDALEPKDGLNEAQVNPRTPVLQDL
jgi:hypothetical protein